MAVLDPPYNPKESPFSQVVDRLRDAGFTPIPVLPRDKAPGEFVGGRWTLMSAWNAYSKTVPEDYKYDMWRRWPDANVGITLGTPCGGYQLIAIDFDTDDEDELDLLQSQIPPSRMMKRGMRGYTAFYRAAMSTRTKRYMIDIPDTNPPKRRCVLEVLTGNSPRQTVMPPSMHPHGQPYAWMTGDCIVPISELPVLSEDHFAQLEDTLEHMGWNGQVFDGRRDRASTDERISTDDPNIWRATNIAALDRMHLWVGELGLPKLRRHPNGSWEAVPFWRPSNNGTEMSRRKPNLKFHREGIKDMGTDVGYTPLDVVGASFSWDFDTCFSWLRQKIGLAKEGEFSITIEKPMYVTKDKNGTLRNQDTGEIVGPDRGKNKTLLAIVEEVPESYQGAEIEADSFAPPTVTKIEDMAPDDLTDSMAVAMAGIPACLAGYAPKTDSDELPDHLTRPPGLLGRIVEFITSSAQSPNDVLAFCAALTLVGTLIGRKFASPTRCGTHLYVLGLGPTGSGKQHPLDMVNKILAKIEAADLIGSSEAMSQTALLKQLQTQPLSLSGVDEFGAYMKRINSRNAGTHDMGIKKVMLSAWGMSFVPMPTPSWAGTASEIIYAPAFSMLAMATPESFYDSLDGADIDNGMLNRFLIFKTDKISRMTLMEREYIDLPEDLRADLYALYRLNEGAMIDVRRNDYKADIQPMSLVWKSVEVHQSYCDLVNAITDLRNNGSKELAPFFARTAELAVRIATIQSMGRDMEDSYVTAEDFEYGKKVAAWSAFSMARQAGLYMSDSANQSETNRVMTIIRKRGGTMEHTALMRALKNRLKSKEVKEILAALVEQRTLSQVFQTPKDGGARQTYYVLQND